MMNELYLKYAEVPKDAQSKIKGGRLNGMTNINPQWRIEALTEMFGMCGQGWYYTIENVNETVADSEIVISVMINLYVKYDDEWSKAITGVGGSKLATIESKGLYVNDEALKMAVTDALSVACKQIGIASNIYRGKENNKYADQKKQENRDPPHRGGAEAGRRRAACLGGGLGAVCAPRPALPCDGELPADL